MEPFVRYRLEAGRAVLTLCRPEARNAVSPPMLTELTDLIAQADAERTARVIVLRAEGPAFSAGGDVHGLLQSAAASGHEARDEAALLAQALAPARALLGSSKPSIALLNGAAAGGGLALALACDYRIAVRGAKLAFAYGRIGLAGDLGATWLLANLVGPRSAYRFAMRPYLDAQHAQAIGLVDELVDDDRLNERGRALADELAGVPPTAAAAIKANLRAAVEQDFDTAGRMEAETFVRLRKTADHLEAVRAFAERRSPGFTGE